MKALDTNILVYAHRNLGYSAAMHARVLFDCHQFENIWHKCFNPLQAIAQIRAWVASPSMLTLEETDTYVNTFLRMAELAKAKGPLIHDPRVLAICHVHDVEILYSFDRDFSKFSSSVRVERPF